jgi:galactonate dehydratase
MVIRELKLFVLNEGRKVSWGTGWSKNFNILRIGTDAGISGIGEAFHSLDEPIAGYMQKFARFLVGRDPGDILRNWQAVYRGLRYPLGTAALAALSAVEQALWDIAGKACGLPVYRMFGGALRDRIRLYASGYLAQPSHFELGSSPLVESCLKTAQMGFTALKITPQPDDWKTRTPAANLRESIARMSAVREALGDDFAICLDYHGRSFSPSEAVQLARRLEPLDPMFLEEPALSDNPASLAWIKSMTTIPIAAGERCVTRNLARGLLESEAVHIFQPEPTANGGITETMRMAFLAELHQIEVAPHHACGVLALAACAHIDACLPNFLIQECNVDPGSEMMRQVFPGQADRIKDGNYMLSAEPGLGVEFDETAATRFMARPYDRPVVFLPDGSVGLE